MAEIPHYIRTLESYAESNGARLVRAALPNLVHGKVAHDRIVLRPDLDPEQELTTLVHELAHWLAHRGIFAHASGVDSTCTVFEYEAEAVEALVMSRLGLPLASSRGANPTDDLLSSSVVRVMWASSQICAALGLNGAPRAEGSQS